LGVSVGNRVETARVSNKGVSRALQRIDAGVAGLRFSAAVEAGYALPDEASHQGVQIVACAASEVI